jgi:hypothetical protein
MYEYVENMLAKLLILKQYVEYVRMLAFACTNIQYPISNVSCIWLYNSDIVYLYIKILTYIHIYTYH